MASNQPKSITRRRHSRHTSEVVLVTNAGTDAGFQITRELLTAGHRVVVTSRHTTDLTRIMHGYGPERVLAIAADTADREQVTRLIARAENHFGRVDSVIRADGSAPTQQRSVRDHLQLVRAWRGVDQALSKAS